jgi:hypothetical protein
MPTFLNHFPIFYAVFFNKNRYFYQKGKLVDFQVLVVEVC